ncbi:MAG: nucleotide exchange factor GrpE [Bacteroidales bacterium]|jgi:molecular chaperone GrpE|nr:nucleotide exchange factor GrpE [Bacteroidales bacterium]
MLKRRFFNKPAKKPEGRKAINNMPDNKDMDTGNKDTEDPETENEEMSKVNPEMNDAPVMDEDFETDEITEAITEEADEEPVALQKELSEAQDKYLRLAAEFDNYRKRTLREKMELMQTAGEALLKDILPVVDDFERGLEVAFEAEDMDAVRKGMTLIYNKLKDFLTSHGVKEISAMNEPFDADWHDAVTNIPAPSDKMKGKVVDVIQKGYTLNDKVMRYPKVVVGE